MVTEFFPNGAQLRACRDRKFIHFISRNNQQDETL